MSLRYHYIKHVKKRVCMIFDYNIRSYYMQERPWSYDHFRVSNFLDTYFFNYTKLQLLKYLTCLTDISHKALCFHLSLWKHCAFIIHHITVDFLASCMSPSIPSLVRLMESAKDYRHVVNTQAVPKPFPASALYEQ